MKEDQFVRRSVEHQYNLVSGVCAESYVDPRFLNLREYCFVQQEAICYSIRHQLMFILQILHHLKWLISRQVPVPVFSQFLLGFAHFFALLHKKGKMLYFCFSFSTVLPLFCFAEHSVYRSCNRWKCKVISTHFCPISIELHTGLLLLVLYMLLILLLIGTASFPIPFLAKIHVSLCDLVKGYFRDYY